jgi:hypothetical protein
MRYVTVQRGVYRHEIVGIHDSLAEAIEAATAWLRKADEGDRYHHVEAVPVGPDGEQKGIVAVFWSKDGGIMSEMKP